SYATPSRLGGMFPYFCSQKQYSTRHSIQYPSIIPHITQWRPRPLLPNIFRTTAMYDYSYVLGLLRAAAADLERRALSGEKQRIARMVTERSLRNRAIAITHRLQGMDELQRHQFVAEAARRLYQDSARPATRRCGRSAWRAPPPSISHD